ncbi:MAG TPA: hypothetical protein VEF04_20605, partial [Blastocatellia bacterium]|nr:hypothetical protein [Blastocatellia bacterium]
LETPQPPAPTDYCFGQFVKVCTASGGMGIGVIYNSMLINPEYGNYGPRLSTPPELNSVFSPDYLNEQGVMIGVLLLGSRNAEGVNHQGVPREVLPINANVEKMSNDEVRAFHHSHDGTLEFHYYAHINTHAGLFAYPLFETIVQQIEKLTIEREQARLAVLKRTLAWQQTVGKINRQ